MNDFLLRAPVVVGTRNIKISRRHLADYVRQMLALHITFYHSLCYVKKLLKKRAARAARLFFNQSNH